MLIEIFKIWVEARKRYFTDILEYMLNPETETVEVPTKEVFVMAKIARKKYFYDTVLNYLHRKTGDGKEEVSKEYIDKALANATGGFGDMLSGMGNMMNSITPTPDMLAVLDNEGDTVIDPPVVDGDCIEPITPAEEVPKKSKRGRKKKETSNAEEM